MLQPKRTKYRKQFRGKMRGRATAGNQLTNGAFGLQSLDRSWVSSRQIEAARKVIVRETKRKAKLWMKIFPDKPYTKKPAEVRMGKGKGDVDSYVAVVKPGRIIMEMSGVEASIAREALRKAAQKLPVKTQIIVREN
ncbi:MAG: 50S ribosomal protein L16 [Candidatus Dojkabacteria bacterium]